MPYTKDGTHHCSSAAAADPPVTHDCITSQHPACTPTVFIRMRRLRTGLEVERSAGMEPCPFPSLNPSLYPSSFPLPSPFFHPFPCPPFEPLPPLGGPLFQFQLASLGSDVSSPLGPSGARPANGFWCIRGWKSHSP